MHFIVLIPARLTSTRLPNKPLADIAGLPMVVRVAQQAMKSRAVRTVVAADSPQIVDVCSAFNIPAILTNPNHLSGSDRLAQACDILALADDQIVVNVQGDEPLMEPTLIDSVAETLSQSPDCAMSSASHHIDNFEDFLNPNVVKVVTNAKGRALYFSRAPIPAPRDATGQAWWTSAGSPPPPLRHIGIYAYRVGFLKKFPTLVPSPAELLESLEQLRVLWHGYHIAIHTTEHAPGPGVDTQQDLDKVRALLSPVHHI